MCGRTPSYGWKSIQAGKDLLQKGLQVQLGDGKETNVWLDHWLPVLPPRKADREDNSPEMTISELWKQGKREWDDAKLRRFLTPEDARLAKTVRLSNFAPKDKLIWPYSLNTEYTVKSGYWVATHLVNNDEVITPPPGSLELKQKTWKLKIAPKIKHFLWKTIVGAIPTAERLCSRSIPIDPTCQRCCLHDETINHLLFECEHAREVWRSAMFTQFNGSASLEDNIKIMFQIQDTQGYPEERRLLPFWMCWMIWKSRNELIFQQRLRHAHENVERSSKAVGEWIAAFPENTVSQGDQPSSSNQDSQWEPPEYGWLKCNFDSSYSQASNFMGVGWILRDYLGAHIASGWAKLPQVSSPLEAEASGFLYVVMHIWSQGWRRVWFEGDNLVLTNIINKQEEDTRLGNLLYDIRHWINRLPLCSMDHVNREKNQAADRLAKCVYDCNVSTMYYVCPPAWLLNYLYPPFTI